YSAPFFPYMIEIKSDNKMALQKPKEEIATTLRANNNNRYNISVEGVQIRKDEFTGKSLDQFKKELAEVLESEDSHSSDEENNIEKENTSENEFTEKLEHAKANEEQTTNNKKNEQHATLQNHKDKQHAH